MGDEVDGLVNGEEMDGAAISCVDGDVVAKAWPVETDVSDAEAIGAEELFDSGFHG